MGKHKQTFKPNRKFLLFSSIDTSRSAHDYWLGEPGRNYDVVLYIYKGEIPELPVDLCVKMEGFKFQNFYAFAKTIDIYHYDAIWIVDDDIQMQTREINRMFTLFLEYGLWIAQPAFDSSSHASWELTVYDDKYILRYSNFVENGALICGREALKLCLPTMKDITTGFGSDFLFPTLVGFPPEKIALIDDVQCHHPSGESTLDILIPRSLHFKDTEELMKKYNFRYYTPRITGGLYRQ